MYLMSRFVLDAAEAIQEVGVEAPKASLGESLKQFWNTIMGLVATFGGRLLAAIAVLILGSLIIKLLTKGIVKAVEKTKLDGVVKKILEKTVKFLLYLVLIIAVVSILGVDMTSVIAILASCGLAVGLALQGALTNLAGGIMLLIFRPFKLGDYVVGSGSEGVVTDMSIFYTTLLTLDNKRVLIPNGELMNATVTNYSAEEIRRVDVDYKITNDANAEQVKQVLLEACAGTEGVLADPAPFARMSNVDDDTYIFTVRGWTKTANYWDTYFNLVEKCSKALQDNGIDDPEERIVVRLQKED